MRSKPAYLVLGLGHGRNPVVRRATQSPPTLAAGEAFIRVVLELPEDFFTKPLAVIEIAPETATVARQAED